MNKVLIKPLLLSVLFYSFSLSSEIFDDLKEFYFPIEMLKEPKVYKYTNLFNSKEVLYWHMKTSNWNGNYILTTTVYDQNFTLIEIFKEEINANGSEIEEYDLFIDSKKIKTELINRTVFKWNQKNNSSINWSIQYNDTSGKNQISKTRTFDGTRTSKIYNKQEYLAIKFKDDFIFSQLNGASEDKYQYYQYSYYAKGLGMIEYVRYFPEGDLVHFKLNNILTEDKWITLINKK